MKKIIFLIVFIISFNFAFSQALSAYNDDSEVLKTYINRFSLGFENDFAYSYRHDFENFNFSNIYGIRIDYYFSKDIRENLELNLVNVYSRRVYSKSSKYSNLSINPNIRYFLGNINENSFYLSATLPLIYEHKLNDQNDNLDVNLKPGIGYGHFKKYISLLTPRKVFQSGFDSFLEVELPVSDMSNDIVLRANVEYALLNTAKNYMINPFITSRMYFDENSNNDYVVSCGNLFGIDLNHKINFEFQSNIDSSLKDNIKNFYFYLFPKVNLYLFNDFEISISFKYRKDLENRDYKNDFYLNFKYFYDL